MPLSWILLWEQWRGTREGIGLVALFLVAYALALHWGDQLLLYIFSRNEHMTFGVAYLAAFGVLVLCFLHEGRHQLSFGFPRRMFALPVHTSILFATRFAYKIIAVGLAATAAGWLCILFIDPVWSPIPGLLLFVGLVLALETLSILICAYGPGGGTAKFLPILPLASFGFYPIICAMGRNLSAGEPRLGDIPPKVLSQAVSSIRRANPGILTEDIFDAVIVSRTTFPEIGLSPWYGTLALFLVFGSVSYWVLMRARSEIGEDLIGDALRRMIDRVDTRGDRTHASALAAQRWLEWRRLTHLLPWVTMVITLLLTLGLYRSQGDQESHAVVAVICLFIGPAIAAASFGYLITRFDQSYLFFVAGRPMSSAMLGRAKLWAGARAVAITYTLMCLLYSAFMFTLFREPDLLGVLASDIGLLVDKSGTLSELLPITAASLLVAVIAIWSLLWLGRAIGVMVWTAGIAAMIGYQFDSRQIFADTVVVIAYRFDSRLTYEVGTEFSWPPVLVIFVLTLTILMLAGCVIAFLFSARKGFVNKKGIVIAIAIWAVLVVLTTPLRSWTGANVPLALALITLPLLPLVVLPATIEWQRHRA